MLICFFFFIYKNYKLTLKGESMIKRLLVIAVLGVMVSGCFMGPLALVGPVTSGFSTASLIQSGVSTGANYVVKKSTGKTIAEHAMTSLQGDIKQSYAPESEPGKILKQSNQPDSYNEISERCRKFDFYCKRILNKNPSLAKSLLPKVESDTGCKKYDFYCKRMSKEKWLQHINQNKSLLSSS